VLDAQRRTVFVVIIAINHGEVSKVHEKSIGV
jgi:hypothetical protein